MKQHSAPENLSTDERLKSVKEIIIAPMPMKKVFIAVFALILLSLIRILHAETQVPIYACFLMLPSLIFTNTSGFITLLAEAIGYSGIFFGVIHVMIASFWQHNRNSYKRRKIIYDWTLLMLGIHIMLAILPT